MCYLLFQPSVPSCLYGHTSANTCVKCVLYLLDFETSSGRLRARTGCRWGEVHHCGTGRCEWDRMCGAVRASPLLTSLLVCQVACRLEWCIAAKTQRGNQEWKQRTPREGSQVDKSLLSLICRLSGGFLKKSCSAAQKIQNRRRFFFFLSYHYIFVLFLRSTAGAFIKISPRQQKMLFLSLFYLQLAVRPGLNNLECRITWVLKEKSTLLHRSIQQTDIISYFAYLHHSDVFHTMVSVTTMEVHNSICGVVVHVDMVINRQSHRAHPADQSYRQGQGCTQGRGHGPAPFIRHTAVCQMAGLGSYLVQTLLAGFLSAHPPARRGTRPDCKLATRWCSAEKNVSKLKCIREIHGILFLIPLIFGKEKKSC